MGPMGCGGTNAQNEVLKIKGDPVHSKRIFIFYASCASKKSRGADLSILKRDFESVPCVLTKLLCNHPSDVGIPTTRGLIK